MEISLMSTGDGGGEYFSLQKSLQADISSSISKLEELFHQVFRQISYFQDKLNGQSGMAAASLKKSLNEHAELMNKSANALLHFSDTVNTLILALEATDEGNDSLITPKGRMAWQYSLSMERIDEEIVLEPGTMKDAAIDFQNNLINARELFSNFTEMLYKVTDASVLPWGDLRGIWSEAVFRGESIAEETALQINSLIDDANAFVREMARLDHMAGAAMIQV